MALRGRGVGTSELARELQRDPRMVRKIVNGETSGAAYLPTLRNLVDRGHSDVVPPRRRTRSGDLVRVRGGKDDTGSVLPKDTGGTYTGDRQGGRFTQTTYLQEEGRIHEIRIPKGKTAKGRAVAGKEILDRVRSAARGQSKDKQKRVSLKLTFANGRVMEVNDYNASTLLNRMNTLGGKDPLGWLRSEMGRRYENLNTDKVAITGVTMNVYTKPMTAWSRRPYEARS